MRHFVSARIAYLAREKMMQEIKQM